VSAPDVEYIEIRGLRQRLLRWGPPSESPIILLHGFLDAAATFQFLVDELPNDWSFVGLDWRGFGESAKQESSYWFPDYFADLDALLDQLSPEAPARLVGHSMGGNVALMYAGIRPQRVRAVASLEGFGLPRAATAQAAERYARWLDELRKPPHRSQYPSLEAFARTLRIRNPRLTAQRALFIAAAWTLPAGDGFELAADPWHRLVNPVPYRRDEAEAVWRRVEAPVLMALGEFSDYLPRLGADGTDEYFADIFRRLTLRKLQGVGHMMHHEDPAQVALHVREFLQALS
jgi:pimeloyl-ACP methyl ester carboxylesterase